MLVVLLALDLLLKQNHVEWQQLTRNMDLMEHGAPALSVVEWEHKQDLVHASAAMLAELLALDLLLRQDHAALQLWTVSMEHMEHSVLVLSHVVVER